MEKLPVIKFLIIRFSSIGDIVLTTPVIRGLKKQVENSEIHYLSKKKYAEILQKNPYIDKLHLLDDNDSNFGQIIKELEHENFHYIIDLHKNLRTLRFKRKLKVISFSFDKLNWYKWLIVNLKINKLPDIHIVDRYMKTVDVFDVNDDGGGLDYFIPQNDRLLMSELPEGFGSGYVVVAIGAQHYTKRMPPEKLAELCTMIEYPVVLAGGNQDAKTAEYIIGEVRKKRPDAPIFSACGTFSLGKSASLVEQCRVLITHDTGLMHIGAAFGKPIISVWGNTIPEFGMYPYRPGADSEIFQTENLKCRPCSKIGFDKCPKKHFKCMNNIKNELIVKKLNQLLTK